MTNSNITSPVLLPFANYKWIWATLQNREGFLEPTTWISILKALYRNEGSSINPSDMNSRSLISELRNLEGAFDMSLVSADRTFLRGYQSYWTVVGTLWPTVLTDSKIKLTDLGKAVAIEQISLEEFSELVVKRFELPNLAIFAKDRTEANEWRSHNIRIKPLQLLLKILIALYSQSGFRNAYILPSELAGIVIPLSPYISPIEIANELVAFREGHLNLDFFPANHFETHSFRNVKEYLTYLAINKYCFVSRINAPSILASNGNLISQTTDTEAYFLNTFIIGKRGQLEDNTGRLEYFNSIAYSGQNFVPDQDNNLSETEQFINYLGYYPMPIPAQSAPSEIRTTGLADWGIDFELSTVLCSKPFILLTGPSGTGKTRSIVKMGCMLNYELLSEHEKSRSEPSNALALVPVGADWNDTRNLLGYRNPFGEDRIKQDGSKTNLTYEITPAIKLLLRASHPAYKYQPHFLVLDEMNLSHVERYFSTFLSIIEADRSLKSNTKFELINKDDLKLIADILADSSPLESESAKRLIGLGHGLTFPPNVYIVGTVNVDETTYMFSPKVLDRALVLEITPKNPREYLSGENEYIKGSIEPPVALNLFKQNIDSRIKGELDQFSPQELFDSSVRRNQIDNSTADEIKNTIIKSLSGTFSLLKPVGFAFGARVTNEIFLYMSTWLDFEVARARGTQTITQKWHSALDQAILCKILPKIHGNKRQLGESLKALSAYFEGRDGESGATYRIGGKEYVVDDSDILGFSLVDSHEKLERMRATLDSTLYTSFI